MLDVPRMFLSMLRTSKPHSNRVDTYSTLPSSPACDSWQGAEYLQQDSFLLNVCAHVDKNLIDVTFASSAQELTGRWTGLG